MYVSVIHRLFLSLILQALLNNFVKVRVILVNKSDHLEDLFWFHMIPKFLHDFVIKEQVASVVELLDIAQDYKKSYQFNVTSHEFFLVSLVVIEHFVFLLI